MTMRATGFDNEKYLDDQSPSILERMGRIGGKLYLEFGGKIAFAYHAARVLPGYDPNVKIRLPQKLRATGPRSSSASVGKEEALRWAGGPC